jgi:hypothetical protein
MGKVAEVLLHWRERPERLSRTAARYSDQAFRRCKTHYIELRVRGRPVVVWGAGPVGKAFGRELRCAGHNVVAFVDLDPRKIGQVIHQAPVIAPDGLESYRGCYVVAAVGQANAREEIRAALRGARWEEVGEFCAVA